MYQRRNGGQGYKALPFLALFSLGACKGESSHGLDEWLCDWTCYHTANAIAIDHLALLLILYLFLKFHCRMILCEHTKHFNKHSLSTNRCFASNFPKVSLPHCALIIHTVTCVIGHIPSPKWNLFS